MRAVLTVDVGNTSVGLTAFDVARGVERLKLQWRGRGEEAEGELARLVERGPLPGRSAVLGSVGARGASLGELLVERGWQVWALDRGDRFPMRTAVEEPERVGVDRLAAAFAASRERPGRHHVVIDLGTAYTVDWVDEEGCFQGGAIVPGRRLSIQALTLGTHNLPELELWGGDAPLTLPGRSTEQAIRHGIDRGFPALVEGLVRALSGNLRPAPELWLTGGDASWFLPRAGLKLLHDPWLVCRGLAWAFRERTE